MRTAKSGEVCCQKVEANLGEGLEGSTAHERCVLKGRNIKARLAKGKYTPEVLS